MTEEWRAVVGFEGLYEVSNMGRVRSLDRETVQLGKGGCIMTVRRRGVILRAAVNKKRYGYRQVNLHADGKQTQRRVCVLVTAAFIGPRPAGHETLHRNGVSSDDRAENLRYGTPKENARDRELHGTVLRGERQGSARLTEADVRALLENRERAADAAARLGVHPGHINNIRRGVRWQHVRVNH